MEVEVLLDRMRFVELVATSRSEAIEELVRAGNWEDQGLATVDVVEAIEAREAAAQTVIAKDIALPHAAIAWDGSFLTVFGAQPNGSAVRCGGGYRTPDRVVGGRQETASHASSNSGPSCRVAGVRRATAVADRGS